MSFDANLKALNLELPPFKKADPKTAGILGYIIVGDMICTTQPLPLTRAALLRSPPSPIPTHPRSAVR